MTHAFPQTVLHTPRLTLRPFTADDTDDTRAACADDLTQHWLPLPRPYTREDAHTWCTRTAHDLRTTGDGIHFAVTERMNGRLAATVGLKKTDWRSRSSEAGYWVAPRGLSSNSRLRADAGARTSPRCRRSPMLRSGSLLRLA
ncbi:GNAT family N-acetyltransferase, partial [Kitasatospora sp. NPDC001119]